jgi:hypothetical protein
MNVIIPIDVIQQKIYLMRGQKVMLSTDLAVLYNVETKVLIQAVKRNIEQGVAMLSCILRSKRAIKVNIEIMRTFVKLRVMITSNATLSRKVKTLKKKYDEQFRVVFEAIRQLMAPPEKKRARIGFKRGKNEEL